MSEQDSTRNGRGMPARIAPALVTSWSTECLNVSFFGFEALKCRLQTLTTWAPNDSLKHLNVNRYNTPPLLEYAMPHLTPGSSFCVMGDTRLPAHVSSLAACRAA